MLIPLAILIGAAIGGEVDEDDTTAEHAARIQALEEELAELKEQASEEELQRLIELAEAEAAVAAEERPEDRVFVDRGRSLQASNPQISVGGDFVTEFGTGVNWDVPWGRLPVRTVGVHIQSDLDPYSTARAALEFLSDPDEPVAVEEAYVTWNAIIPSTSLRVGRFRQQLGVVNRWHEHDLDQVDYPMPLLELTGGAGVLGNGLGATWFMPRLWAHAQELSVDVVTSDAEALVGGGYVNPSALLRLKSFWDVSEATYLEWGLSGLGVLGDVRALPTMPALGDWSRSVVLATDLTLAWSPAQRAAYESFTWRTEALAVQREVPGEAPTWGFGAWSYVQGQAGPRLYLGTRGDILLDDGVAWRIGPYATFWQSEFVFIRLEYGYTAGLHDIPDHRAMLQVSWAVGPHKHERY